MAVVTLGEAARLPGLGKTTLAIELARVYPFPAPAADTTVKATGPTAPPATPTTTGATVALEAQIAGLREVGELLRRQLDDVREDRDRWRRQAERLHHRGPGGDSWHYQASSSSSSPRSCE
jgi:hypothetical protein